MRPVAVSIAILSLTGCGYVGPVLPPSPEIPAAILDLAAVERGDQLFVTFTTPPRTTDGVAITSFSSIDLTVNGGSAGEKTYDVDLPPPSDRDDPQPKPISFKIAVSAWSGQRVSLSVRTAVRKSGHFSAASNPFLLDVIPPLEPPLVHAEGSADGIVLTWNALDNVEYRIQRQGASDKLPVDLGTATGGKYVDSSAQYDTPYSYTLTAIRKMAESLPSPPVTLTAVDTFPPAVPTGLTILAGPDAVNLAWQRDTEPDLQGYYIYRSTNGKPLERLPSIVSLPTYVDRAVQHGATYSYRVVAVDKRGNASAQSNAVETQY